MKLTRSKIFKLFIVSLTLCCLATSAFGGKLSVMATKYNTTNLAESIKTDAVTREVAAARKHTHHLHHEHHEHHEEDHETDEKEEEAEDDDCEEHDAHTSAHSTWGGSGSFWDWIKDDINENLFADNAAVTYAASEGRTFGKIRRLQMALIPIVFKFGVLSAMITFLVALGVKTFFLVKVLVVMNLLAILAKFFTFKKNFGHVEHFSGHGHVEHFPGPPAPMWSPYISTPEEHHVNKEIHLHIHGGHLESQAPSFPYGSGTTGQTLGFEKRNDPYSAYDNIALQGQQNQFMGHELPHTVNSVVSKGQQYGRSFPENHRAF